MEGFYIFIEVSDLEDWPIEAKEWVGEMEKTLDNKEEPCKLDRRAKELFESGDIYFKGTTGRYRGQW